MLDIQKIDHIGIRVRDKDVSIGFYQSIGFALITDIGFEKGHPVIMQHASGVVINLLGPSTEGDVSNILMDVDHRHTGITHVSFKVANLEIAKAALAEAGIDLTGNFSFKGLSAVFFRDPDRNVIELDCYVGDEPETRAGYKSHP